MMLLIVGHMLLSSLQAGTLAEAVCNEVCVYYTNRGAMTLADKRGDLRGSYREYSECIVGLAKTYDWARVTGTADAQAFLDESWTTCAAARDDGDRAAMVIAQRQVADLAQARRAVDEKRAMDAYILTSLLFQKAGRGAPMSAYVAGMRAKMAPDLERK